MGFQINIDNGGTLTDICVIGDRSVTKAKVITTPHDLSKCFFDGLQKASGTIYGAEDVRRLLEEVDLIRYSTTQGTNAICERKGPQLGLILATDSRDLPGRMGEQDPRLYEALVGSRVAFIDASKLDDPEAHITIVRAINELTALGASRLVVSFDVKDFAHSETQFKRIALRKYPRHLLGAVPILYGSDLSNDRDPLRRTWTAVINSFLHPAMESFLYNAENRLRAYRVKQPLLIFRNDGDASRVAKTIALKTYSSGPRGGMEGVRSFARKYGLTDVVSIDVGGTTTDIGQYLDGVIAEQRRGRVEGISVSFALCEIVSAGCGGSSIFKVENGAIVIGPESVGAAPGPACFGRGGKEATITDATLLSGIFDPASYFGGGLPLDSTRAAAAITARIAKPLDETLDRALLRMESAYEAQIAAEIQRHTQVSPLTSLLAFGGAGPLNACGVAEKARIDTVIVPQMAAVFSAYGIGSCNVAQHYSVALEDLTDAGLAAAFATLKQRAARDMFAEGYAEHDYEINVRLAAVDADGSESRHPLSNPPVLPPTLSRAAAADLELSAVKALRVGSGESARFERLSNAVATGTRKILTSGGRLAVPVYQLAKLSAGDHADGPAIIEEDYFTCRVREGWRFVISDAGDILLTRKNS